jgi:SAM-dependent methyltransferase
MNWRIKALTQKGLSHMPCGGALNTYLQRYLGGLRHFDQEVEGKIGDWLLAMEYIHEVGASVENADMVEIGTGWFPTLPVCFALAGMNSCETYDLNPQLHPKMTFAMLRLLGGHIPRIAGCARRPITAVRQDYEYLMGSRSLGELLGRARIRYHAPADASQTGLNDNSVDLVFSNSVLEHIPQHTIVNLFRESQRFLKPGGLAVHAVNCGDHYAYFDKKISAINYLQYSSAEWRLWNNDLLFQNRLRPRDFLEIAKQTQFDILTTKQKLNAKLSACLGRMKIAPEFAEYAREELACTTIDFVAQVQP